jgi:hypothetical protein
MSVKTVQMLKEWLANKPGGAKVEVMIEHDGTQYQFDANDFAFSKDGSVIILHEEWDGKDLLDSKYASDADFS